MVLYIFLEECQQNKVAEAHFGTGKILILISFEFLKRK